MAINMALLVELYRFRNMAQADLAFVHGDNGEVIKRKRGFDGVEQFGLGQGRFDVEPDAHSVEFW